ncbi:putative leucine-rich repeat domain-like protein, partial [Tanacetum coccineum]
QKNESPSSRMWWSNLTQLNFDAGEGLHKISKDPALCFSECDKYVNQVNNVIRRYNHPTVHDFRVCFHFDDQGVINEWLQFAINKKVEFLEVDAIDRSSLKIPLGLFGRRHHVVLLKKLMLKKIDVTDDNIVEIVANCPHLETISIHGSYRLENIRVGGRALNLKHIEIVDCVWMNSIYLSDFDLVSFTCKFLNGWPIDLRLTQLPKLKRLDIHGIKGMENNLTIALWRGEHLKLSAMYLMLAYYYDAIAFIRLLLLMVSGSNVYLATPREWSLHPWCAMNLLWAMKTPPRLCLYYFATTRVWDRGGSEPYGLTKVLCACLQCDVLMIAFAAMVRDELRLTEFGIVESEINPYLGEAARLLACSHGGSHTILSHPVLTGQPVRVVAMAGVSSFSKMIPYLSLYEKTAILNVFDILSFLYLSLYLDDTYSLLITTSDGSPYLAAPRTFVHHFNKCKIMYTAQVKGSSGKVENLIIGAPCHVMDQMASACGEANKLLTMVCQNHTPDRSLGKWTTVMTVDDMELILIDDGDVVVACRMGREDGAWRRVSQEKLYRRRTFGDGGRILLDWPATEVASK